MNNLVEKKYDCKFLARCNNKYCNFKHPTSWDPVKNYMLDWQNCHQINPSVLPYALEFAIELYTDPKYSNCLFENKNLNNFNTTVQNYLREKRELTDIIEIEKWIEDIRWAMVIELEILNDYDFNNFIWLCKPADFKPKKYRPANSYFYNNKNSYAIKSNICKNGEYGYRCYKAMCVCRHKEGHNFREAFEKFYRKNQKVVDIDIKIPEDFEFTYNSSGDEKNICEKELELDFVLFLQNEDNDLENFEEKIYKGMLRAVKDFKIMNPYNLNVIVDISDNVDILKHIKEFKNIKEEYEKKYDELKELHTSLKKIDSNILSIIDKHDNEEIEKTIFDVSKYFQI